MAPLKGTLTPAHTVRGEMSVGGGGTNNYPDLENLPQINGVELVGNKSLDDLGIVNSSIVANPYDATSTYAVGEYVTHDNNLYKCNTAITTAEEWNAEHWTLVDVISAIPTKTSELDNDSGFITGDNYYDKSEIDTALSGKADKSDTYTKSQVDTALSGKANASDTYTKTETDNKIVGLIDDNSTANNKAWSASKIGGELSGKASTGDLALKADKSDTYTKAQTDSAIVGLIDDTTTANNKAWSSSKITDEIINILPTGTASGSVASFNTSLALPLVSCSVDVLATKVYQRGANICEESYLDGYIDSTDGHFVANANSKASKNFNPCTPTTEYYCSSPNNPVGYICWFDADKQFISRIAGNGQKRTSPANAYYFKFSTYGYGATYNNNIAVLYPSSNTSYVAYNSNSRDIDVSDLDTISTFSGENNLFADNGNISVTYKKSINDAIAELQALILS